MKNFNKIVNDFRKYFVSTEEFSFLPSNNLFLYPIDLSFTLDDAPFYYHPLDSKGIPYKVYSSVGEQYNPTRVAAYGLANYNLFIESGDKIARDVFLKVANWFLAKHDARYEYKFDWLDLKSPWISCMAQGEAASVLVRAYIVTHDDKYLRHAKKSLSPFLVDISEGGVRSYLPDGSVFLEEYPSERPTHVLNGFLYSLIGLGEYCHVSDDEHSSVLFFDLIESLVNNIHLWSSGYWSLYEVPQPSQRINNYCTPSYHNLQISQLKWVLENTSSNNIDKIMNAWEVGLDSFPVRMQAMVGKVIYRLRNKAQR
ncbi:D-glucuronyl C5-epimerase family protein [Halomonas sp. 18H]|nr:D-glucuronyl C5-epimerase family protein [Halomonas sp. 18H]MCW4152621.1 D-glucuronyl C5-epimerase family protein [Halomonas sp. 18H]